MTSLWIEVRCPKHGFERYKIDIVRKYNIEANAIQPKFRNKPKPELSYILIGKRVDEKSARDYLVNYLRERGILEAIVSMRLVT